MMNDEIIKRFGVDYLDDRDKYLATKFLDLAVALNEIVPNCPEKISLFEDLLKTRRNVIPDRVIDVVPVELKSAPDSEFDSDLKDPPDDKFDSHWPGSPDDEYESGSMF